MGKDVEGGNGMNVETKKETNVSESKDKKDHISVVPESDKSESEDSPSAGPEQKVEAKRVVISDPGARIRRLKCFDAVDQMVREGRFLRDIAAYIQIDCGEMTDMSDRAVVFMVRQYRDFIYSDAAIANPKGHGLERGVDKEDPFYILYSMRRNYCDLEDRIAMEKDTEFNLNKLFSTTHREYMTLTTLGKEIMKMQKQLGLLDVERGGNKQRVGSGTPGRLDLAGVVANPESRQKVITFLDSVLGDSDFMEDVLGKKKDWDAKKEEEKKATLDRVKKHRGKNKKDKIRNDSPDRKAARAKVVKKAARRVEE